MHYIFRFILFYRITYDSFCPIKIKITTYRCVVVKDVFVKERHFSDNLIHVPLHSYLTLELPHQSNCLVLQLYFKIPTSCYIFFRNDVMTFATITKRII